MRRKTRKMTRTELRRAIIAFNMALSNHSSLNMLDTATCQFGKGAKAKSAHITAVMKALTPLLYSKEI